MYAITCDLTGITGYAGCLCPPGHDPAGDAGHHELCQLSDINALVDCTPDCCDQHDDDDGHDHEPKICTAVHGACPTPSSCKVWINLRSHVEDPDAAGMPVSCPGGHHGYGVEGCVVCHPLTITWIPAEPIQLRRAEA